jgi:NAD-dependent protein deacetylase/lipoamidase
VASEEGIRRLAAALREAERVTIVTGAGVSAASGIPTFRSPGGLWRNRRPEELATPEAFARDPKMVWEWYAWRRDLVAKAHPNRAHEVLAAWSRRFPRFTLVTQNVDGLHERAGTENVIRFHGSLWELTCASRCAGSPAAWRHDEPFDTLPPTCPFCAGLARPGVVWFGEAIPLDALSRARAALDCDVCIAIGTSAVVYPAAALVAEAAERGAWTAEINPEATPASAAVDLALACPAEQALDDVERRLSEGDPPRRSGLS